MTTARKMRLSGNAVSLAMIKSGYHDKRISIYAIFKNLTLFMQYQHLYWILQRLFRHRVFAHSNDVSIPVGDIFPPGHIQNDIFILPNVLNNSTFPDGDIKSSISPFRLNQQSFTASGTDSTLKSTFIFLLSVCKTTSAIILQPQANGCVGAP